MSKQVQPIPAGYHTLTPYLICRGAKDAIEFYKRAFDARELFRMDQPDGSVGHAELQIGDSRLMVADEAPALHLRGPQSMDGTGVTITMYVEDVDEIFARAVAAGARVQRPLEDQFYGDRAGAVKDPFGHSWHIATHKEDLSFEELQRRAAAEQPVY